MSLAKITAGRRAVHAIYAAFARQAKGSRFARAMRRHASSSSDSSSDSSSSSDESSVETVEYVPPVPVAALPIAAVDKAPPAHNTRSRKRAHDQIAPPVDPALVIDVDALADSAEPRSKRAKVSSDEETVCVLCIDAPPDTLVLPCGCVVLCKACATRIARSPHAPRCVCCRQDVHEIVADCERLYPRPPNSPISVPD